MPDFCKIFSYKERDEVEIESKHVFSLKLFNGLLYTKSEESIVRQQLYSTAKLL